MLARVAWRRAVLGVPAQWLPAAAAARSPPRAAAVATPLRALGLVQNVRGISGGGSGGSGSDGRGSGAEAEAAARGLVRRAEGWTSAEERARASYRRQRGSDRAGAAKC